MLRLILCVLILASVPAFAAEEGPFGAVLDAQGYPLDDPAYDDVRRWYELERLGMNQYRNEMYEKAYETLSEPARRGYKRAQHTLALMHLEGYGVDKHPLVGVALLGLASESGDRRLTKEYEKSVKALPEKHQQVVRDQTAYYIARYGMKVQGVTCSMEPIRGSNRKTMTCVKGLGNHPDIPWAPT